jgi:type IV secretory pathway VirB2 component (pilin)
MATFAAPAAGVFPYLLLTGWPAFAPGVALWLPLVLGNVAVGLMLVLLSYSVAFFGALTPDRVVKHRLVRFLLRGPFVATLVVVVIVAALQAEGWLGLPGHHLMLFGVVGVILLLQLGIELAKPLIDRALYRRDQPEIEWIQQLGNRLLTTTDLHQFLENVLAALCDLLRVRTAFVTVIDGGVPHLEVVCGPLEPGAADLPPEAWQALAGPSSGVRRIERHGDLFVWNGYWLVPLYTPFSSLPIEGGAKGRRVVGVVGVAARAPEPDLSPEERVGMEALLAQAVVALEDRQLQQGIFSALERIIPEIEDIQRRRGVLHYVGEQALSGFSLVEARVARERDGDAMKGLRTVLKQAIERLRPDGQRQMTAPEWVLYNILELKFLQGRRVREIARRLAMSESDLYRKQRIAIEAVSQTLAEMEREELSNGNADSLPSQGGREEGTPV